MRILFLFLLCLTTFGCGKKEKPSRQLQVAASPTPHAKILEFVKPKLEAQGIDLQIIELDDYQIPNRALSENEVDANFFQHIPFMEDQVKAFGYKITCFAKIHIEPMGIYSIKHKSLEEIPNGGTIALPNDPTNEFRALSLLEKKGLITLRPGVNLKATVADIQKNPKKLNFREIDASLLPRALKDIDAAAIPTNFALEANLNPKQDALAIEGTDSPYVNIIAIRTGDEQDPKLTALREAMLSDEMRKYIETTWNGEIIPVLTQCF